MKILLVSMPSLHVMRWVENLSNSKHELFWFDVMGRGKLNANKIDESHQFTNWNKRKLPYIKGEFYISKNYPKISKAIQVFLEVTASEKLEELITLIQPDVVHSFEMQSCSFPILKTMNKFPKLKWIYSCWGSDLFYYSKYKSEKNKIQAVLKRVNFMLSDCNRDQELALKLGFEGQALGIVFGGGGYHLETLEVYKKTIFERKIILVKGYEHEFGRALNVVKALELLKDKLSNYQVHVFGTHEIVEKYITHNNLNFKIHGRHNLAQQDLLQLMGKTLIYIGNSISDGMPNTLLESIVMGAFPIQSNPGGASLDVIKYKVNGLLIEDPYNIKEIASHITLALTDNSLINRAMEYNSSFSKVHLNYNVVKNKIINAYNVIIN